MKSNGQRRQRPRARSAPAVAGALAMAFAYGPAPAQDTPEGTTPPIVNAPFSESEIMSLDMLQEAWDAPGKHLGKHQRLPGYRRIVYDPRRITVHDFRTGMWTRISLSPSEEILWAVPGDATIDVKKMSPNTVLVKPIEAGMDTNLTLLTRSGRAYTMVVRGVNHRAETLLDMIVEIIAPGAQGASGTAGATRTNAPRGRNSIMWPGAGTLDADGGVETRWSGRGDRVPGGEDRWNELADATTGLERVRSLARLQTDQRPDGAYGNLETQAFDPAELFHDLAAYASSTEAIEAIGPERVFRSRVWTYIGFGREKAASMQDWPVALRVVDDTEAPVASTIGGVHKEMLIVKAVGRIVLRSGRHVICIVPKKKQEGLSARAPESIPIQTGPPAPAASHTASAERTEAQTAALRTLSSSEAAPGPALPAPAPGEEVIGHRVAARLSGADATARAEAIAAGVDNAEVTAINATTDEARNIDAAAAETICTAALAAGIACSVRNA